MKWLVGIFTHPINIIKGNWFRFTNKYEKLYYSRYKECIFCEERQKSPIGEICGLCGCPLESKLRIAEEICELDRWV